MKPILFNTEMVKAILDGRKTQTRRVVKLPDCKWGDGHKTKVIIVGEFEKYNLWTKQNDRKLQLGGLGDIEDYLLDDFICEFSRYKTGDILYVRETFGLQQRTRYGGVGEFLSYKANYNDILYHEGRHTKNKNDEVKWKPSIHMPKEYARIFLKVTNVRVERLQDMSFEDIFYEGFNGQIKDYFITDRYKQKMTMDNGNGLDRIGLWWINLWNSTAKDGYKWEDNPYVFVYEFERTTNDNNS